MKKEAMAFSASRTNLPQSARGHRRERDRERSVECFTGRDKGRYNLSAEQMKMRTKRRNPQALDDAKLSVVIPVYNERATIEEILRRVQDAELRKEIVLVDDCSTDGTRQILENMAKLAAGGETGAPAQDGGEPVPLQGVRIYFQDRNQGKGAALRKGFAEATGDIVVVQDADLEYDPRDYEKLLEPIVDGRADVVY